MAKKVVEETLVSHLLKSNCLITHQPDWGSIQIQYRGRQIDREKLLRYLVSFRHHNEFHEQCVERIFNDLLRFCQPEKLSVYARYTRRGGLDINPWRSNSDFCPIDHKTGSAINFFLNFACWIHAEGCERSSGRAIVIKGNDDIRPIRSFFLITHISPLGSMDMLSQLEVDMLKRTASSDLYQLFRNCSLAVLNSGSLTDNSKELLSRFENFDINVLRRERGVKAGTDKSPRKRLFVDGRIIRALQANLFAVLRDILFVYGQIHNTVRFPNLNLDNSVHITNPGLFHLA